jgi:hypothetical protein
MPYVEQALEHLGNPQNLPTRKGGWERQFAPPTPSEVGRQEESGDAAVSPALLIAPAYTGQGPGAQARLAQVGLPSPSCLQSQQTVTPPSRQQLSRHCQHQHLGALGGPSPPHPATRRFPEPTHVRQRGAGEEGKGGPGCRSSWPLSSEGLQSGV